ncbi:outer membrane protein [Ruegeria arenilitoris]|uniref:outer membrane protein n=1 Tax=Ruegeria arenilitoris TaxID=1173585 RepID=UPI0020C40C52|nr:porin family protein [Ruegeria arenilitoris]
MVLKRFFTTAAIAAASYMPMATASWAQLSDWSYAATIYLFTPETDVSQQTARGKVEGTLSFSDALENLDLAFMGTFSATNGRWSILADYNYTDLTFSNDTPGGVNSGVETALTTQFFSGYLGYRVYSSDTTLVDVAGGFRWFKTETGFTVLPGTAPGRSVNVNSNWTDPVIGIRARTAFNDRWSGTGFFDYGGFTNDSETWQVLLTADYAINERWLLRFGYRYISFDHEINGNDFKFSQSGPVIGATYRF